MKAKSQTDRLFDLLKDGEPHSTEEICQLVYGSSQRRMARAASRAHDIRKRGYKVDGFEKDGMFYYQLDFNYKVPPKKPEIRIVEREGRLVAVYSLI